MNYRSGRTAEKEQQLLGQEGIYASGQDQPHGQWDQEELQDGSTGHWKRWHQSSFPNVHRQSKKSLCQMPQSGVGLG